MTEPRAQPGEAGFVDWRIRTFFGTYRVSAAVYYATSRALEHAAVDLVRLTRAEIKTGLGPSRPGEPVHTRSSRRLPKVLTFAVIHAERETNLLDVRGIVGVRYGSGMGEVATVHELGGEYMGQLYPPRPFMGPSLEKHSGVIAPYFEDSLDYDDSLQTGSRSARMGMGHYLFGSSGNMPG